MTAPNRSTAPSRRADEDSGLLRLRMAANSLDARLDGVWWPRSRNIVTEIADLVDHFPAKRFGRVVRVLVSPADWDSRPGHVLVRNGIIKVRYLAESDDSHLIHLTTSDRTLLPLLVVPPSFTRDQGDAALAAAVTHEDTRSASALIERVRTGTSRRMSPGSAGHGAVRWSRRPADLSLPSTQA
jgi:Family of unknown function (DUF5994)